MSKFSAQDFSTGSVYKHLINLAVPMTAAMIVQVCYSLVDRIYLGHLSDTSNMALTGLGLSFPLISIVMAFTSLFSTGATPLFSIVPRQARSENRAKNYRQHLCNDPLFCCRINAGFLHGI